MKLVAESPHFFGRNGGKDGGEEHHPGVKPPSAGATGG